MNIVSTDVVSNELKNIIKHTWMGTAEAVKLFSRLSCISESSPARCSDVTVTVSCIYDSMSAGSADESLTS